MITLFPGIDGWFFYDGEQVVDDLQETFLFRDLPAVATSSDTSSVSSERHGSHDQTTVSHNLPNNSSASTPSPRAQSSVPSSTCNQHTAVSKSVVSGPASLTSSKDGVENLRPPSTNSIADSDTTGTNTVLSPIKAPLLIEAPPNF